MAWVSCTCNRWRLEHPLVLLLDFMALVALAYLLVYSLVAANYGSWSDMQNHGYYCFFVTTSVFLCCNVWLIYFFHTFPRSHYRQAMVAPVGLVLGACYLLGALTVYFLTYIPSKNEMRHFLQRGYFGGGYVTGVFERLQIESKCCGVENYTDYTNPLEHYTDLHFTQDFLFKEFPDSCCLRVRRNCGLLQHYEIDWFSPTDLAKFIHVNGCVKKRYSDIKHTKIYKWFYVVTLNALVPPFFPIIIIIIMQIIFCLTKPKPQITFLPSRKASWEAHLSHPSSTFNIPLAVTDSSPDISGQLPTEPISRASVLAASTDQKRP